MSDRTVDVWIRDTSQTQVAAAGAGQEAVCVDGLDEHERRRWRGFADPQDAAAYLGLHLLARSEIGRVLRQPPQSLRFDRTCPDCGLQHGAPRLLDDPDLRVSLSRSRRVVALALSRVGPLGIDVELCEETAFDGFGSVALHPDERQHTPGSLAATTAWVRKEASLKALGVGLRVDATTFATPVPGVAARVVVGLPSVTVADVAVPPGYAAAVAVRSTSGDLDVVGH